MELAIRHLFKRYPNGVQALKDVTLTISPGMFGLLGPNGAGKTTLMRILATLQDADCGTAQLDNLDVLGQKPEVRKLLGYLPQEFGLYPRVSAQEMLDHFALLKGVAPARHRRAVVERLLRQTNLYDVRHRKLGAFSGGMKQRFGVAQALLGDPRLLIVDEPTAGLDPEERIRFHNLLSEIGEQIIVILSTHIVADVSDLCYRMAVLHKGEVLVEGEPAHLAEQLRGRIWAKVIDRGDLATEQARHAVISTRLQAGKTLMHVYATDQPDSSFAPSVPTLEDVYFHAIQGPNTDAPPSPELAAEVAR